MAAKKRTRLLRWITIFIAALAAVAAIFFITWWVLKDPTDNQAYTNIVQAVDSLRTAPGESWLREKELNPRTDQEIIAEASLITQLTDRLNNAITDDFNVPELREERSLFAGQLMPTILSGQSTRWVMTGQSPTPDLMHGKFLEVVFYAHQDFRNPMVHEHLLFYNAGWGSLLVAMLRFPDEAWFKALLSHELWHAVRHRQGSPTSVAPQLSDPWVDEELEAHSIEAKSLNGATHGEYERRLQAIVNSHKWTLSIKQFLNGVTLREINHLDRLFGPALTEEKDMRGSEYYLNLGERWLARHSAADQLQEKRRELYRYLITPHSTNVQ
jgi:hypothetical protein